MIGWANELWGGLIHDGMEDPPASGWPLEVDATGGASSVITPTAGGEGTPLSECVE